VKLLFDQNLSPKLTRRLADVYPGSEHVADIGLDRASDRKLWAYAEREALTVVSKDSDFSEISTLEGFPPDVIWIRRGNCSTAEIEEILRANREAAEELKEDAETGILAVY
jgi:predicted nuclease of predicted toxin-antitoxin system